MADIEAFRKALAARVLDGAGESPSAQRRAAFENDGLSGPLQSLVAKVVDGASAIGDADVAAARAAGLTEDQLFELVICAAVGQATRLHEGALAALERAATAGDGR
jgi:alkylhydroperoxidase family enzyme